MAGTVTSKANSLNLNAFSAPVQADIKAAPKGVIADIFNAAKAAAASHGFTKAQTTELEDTSIATSAVETGGTFNPTIVGDQGTSFGLFQLHEGGELGDLPGNQSQEIQEAYNPLTNATQAVGGIADWLASTPGASPGVIAAQAQGPADKQGYAQSVNADLTLGTATGAAGSSSLYGLNGGGTTGTPSTNTNPASTTAASGSGNLLGKIGGFLLGALLIGIGIIVAFKDTGAGQAVKSVGKDAGVAAVAA